MGQLLLSLLLLLSVSCSSDPEGKEKNQGDVAFPDQGPDDMGGGDMNDTDIPPIPDGGMTDPGPSELSAGPLCLQGWCWEDPAWGAESIFGIAPLADGHALIRTGSYVLHIDGDDVRYAAPQMQFLWAQQGGIWGSGPTNAWLFTATGAFQFDGSRWNQRANVGAGTSVSGTAANDIWAISGFGLRHYDGAWHTVEVTDHMYRQLHHVCAVETGVAAVIGGFSDTLESEDFRTEVFIVSRQAVESLDLPTELVPNIGMPQGIWAASRQEVWVAFHNRVLRYTNGDWEVMTEGFQFRGIWGSGPSDVYILGSGALHRYDGSEVRDVTVSDNLGIPSAIAGTSSNNVWLGTWNGNVYHFNGNSWRNVHATRGTTAHGALAIDANGNGLAGFVSPRGVRIRSPEGDWTDSGMDFPHTVDGVAAAGTERFVFTSQGTYHLNNGQWNVTTNGAGLRMACEYEGEIYAVGSQIARWNNGQWETMVDGLIAPLQVMSCQNDGIWAAGHHDRFEDGEHLLHFAGEEWTRRGLRTVQSWENLRTFQHPDRLLVGGYRNGRIELIEFVENEWVQRRLPPTTRGVGVTTAGDVLLVGVDGMVETQDGTNLSMPDGPEFRWAGGTDLDNIRAISSDGFVWEYDGEDWTRISERPSQLSSLVSDNLSHVAFLGMDIYAIGGGRAIRLVDDGWENLNYRADDVIASPALGAIFAERFGELGRVTAEGIERVDNTFRDAESLAVSVDGTRLWIVTRSGLYRLADDRVIEDRRGNLRQAYVFGTPTEPWLVHWDAFGRNFTIEKRSAGEWGLWDEPANVRAVGSDMQGRTLFMDHESSLYRLDEGFIKIQDRSEQRITVTNAVILSENDIYATSGVTLMRLDGAQWTPIPISIGVRALTASPSGDLFLLTENGGIVSRR